MLFGRTVLVVAACLCALALPAAAQGAAGPANLRVTEVRASGATLTWDAPDAEVYGYGIHDLDAPETGNQVGWSFSTTGTASLRPGTRYRLAVRALLIRDGELVDSPFSNAVTFTTPPDTTPPTAPHARAEGQTATTASLAFSGAADDVGVEAWVISDGTRIWTQPAWMQWRFTATGLETNRTHRLTVRARDAAGNLSPPSNELTFELENQPPTAPANPRVEGAELVWDASTDNVAVVDYLVFVDGDPQAFAVSRSTRAPLRFCDDDFNPTFCFPELGEPHTYVVRARDRSRNLSPPSEPLVVPAG
jgi:fibronectin type III domain protein